MRMLWWIGMMGAISLISACGPVGAGSLPVPNGPGMSSPGNPNSPSQGPDSFVFGGDSGGSWSAPDVQSGGGDTVSQWDEPDEICGYWYFA